MQTVNVLGLSLGESFVEFALLAGSKVIAVKRSYLPRENMKSSLQAFLDTHKETPIHEAYISLRVPQKLFDHRLGGSVATLSTAGLEAWPALQNTKQDIVIDKELQCSVAERIGADGKVITPLNVADLEPIAVKLEGLSCKKICLQFLHAGLFPQHQNLARDFFQAKGFEVFCPAPSDNPDETSRWRTHSLNALAASVFSEIKQDLLGILTTRVSDENIFFVNSKGTLEKSADTQALSGHLSHLAALAATADKNKDLLYLGLEGFYVLHTGQANSHWKSPWGILELPHVKFSQLHVHPTQRIDLNSFGRLDFATTHEGWEPGPMMMGRGQKPTLIDLWSDSAKLAELETFTDRLVAAGQQRFKNTLFTLSKTNGSSTSDLSGLMKGLQSLAVQKLVTEVILKKQNGKIQVTGPLSSLFANGFKKDAQTSVDAQEYGEAAALATWGRSLAKAQ